MNEHEDAPLQKLDISVALFNVLANAGIRSLADARERILSGELKPGSRVGYGEKRHAEVCALLSLPLNAELPEARHPGEHLRSELDRREITPYRLAVAAGLSHSRLSDILYGRRSITADAATRLARVLGGSARAWLARQADYDLAEIQRERRAEYAALKPL